MIADASEAMLSTIETIPPTIFVLDAACGTVEPGEGGAVACATEGASVGLS